jgi:hypothetical protein
MPFEIEDHPRFLLVRLLPVLTRDDLVRAATGLAQVEAMLSRHKNRITDLSPLDAIEVSFADVEMVAKMRRELKLAAPIRSAFIAPRPIQFGFARMFQTLNDNPQILIEIFDDEPTALAWLRA